MLLFCVIEKSDVAVNFCASFGKVLVIFPHFFHANAETISKPRHNSFLPIFFFSFYHLSLVLLRSYKK